MKVGIADMVKDDQAMIIVGNCHIWQPIIVDITDFKCLRPILGCVGNTIEQIRSQRAVRLL